jgi:hypothetical protein
MISQANTVVVGLNLPVSLPIFARHELLTGVAPCGRGLLLEILSLSKGFVAEIGSGRPPGGH